MPPKEIAEIFLEASDRTMARKVLDTYLFREEAAGNLQIRKVWPKPGNRFVILYHAEGKRGTRWAVSYLFPPEAGSRKNEVPRKAVYIPEWNGFIQEFPDDFRMPHLRAAVDPKRAASFISLALERNGTCWKELEIKKAEPRGYWPGKRCQIEYRGTLPGRMFQRLFAKVHREESGKQIIALHGALRKAGFDGSGGLVVPRPMAYCPELRASLMEPGEGRVILGLLDTSEASRIVSRAGGFLASLHKAKAPLPNPEYRVGDEIELLKGWHQVIGLISFKKARAVAEVLEKLKQKAEEARTPLCTSHRDFHDKQILFDGESMTLLDLDTACLAPAELDAGNFLAHLSLRGIEQDGDADKYSGLEEPFLEGCLGSGEILSKASLSWFRAASLLRLACRYLLQPGGALYFDSLIFLAQKFVHSLKESTCVVAP